jgi:hypothetical protein
VARLLITVPTLSLTACNGEDLGCFPYPERPATATFSGNLADGGVATNDTCLQVCQTKVSNPTSCEVEQVPETYADGGTGTGTRVRCHYISPAGCATDGRVPEGLQEARVEARCALGAHFAEMAWLEAASVPAFLRLADELKAHGAPEALIRAARRSAGDEVRHTRAAGELARRHGASVPEVELEPFSERSLEEMLLENAREGCVRETYGAVVAAWQAQHAQDAQVREELRRIAADELRHSELAWAVADWAAERLTPEAQQRVRDARHEAFQELERALAEREPELLLIQQAGLPSREASLQLLRGLQPLLA